MSFLLRYSFLSSSPVHPFPFSLPFPTILFFFLSLTLPLFLCSYLFLSSSFFPFNYLLSTCPSAPLFFRVFFLFPSLPPPASTPPKPLSPNPLLSLLHHSSHLSSPYPNFFHLSLRSYLRPTHNLVSCRQDILLAFKIAL